jgi:hypothetical protein
MAQRRFYWPPLADAVIVSKECHDAMMYVSSRSGWSTDLESRLLRADKISGFDWSSVSRGEEDDELRKHGITPRHDPADLVNPWPNARPEAVSLLATLFKEGKLTYAIQNGILKADKQIRFLLEENKTVREEIVHIFLGEGLEEYAPFLMPT